MRKTWIKTGMSGVCVVLLVVLGFFGGMVVKKWDYEKAREQAEADVMIGVEGIGYVTAPAGWREVVAGKYGDSEDNFVTFATMEKADGVTASNFAKGMAQGVGGEVQRDEERGAWSITGDKRGVVIWEDDATIYYVVGENDGVGLLKSYKKEI